MVYELQHHVKRLLDNFVPSGDLPQQKSRASLEMFIEAMWAASPRDDAPKSMRECIERAQVPGHSLDYDRALLDAPPPVRAAR